MTSQTIRSAEIEQSSHRSTKDKLFPLDCEAIVLCRCVLESLLLGRHCGTKEISVTYMCHYVAPDFFNC